MILEVRHLELVEAIHREGRVTAAAERLHLSQPAASHALGKLERRLGTKLFERRPGGMRITEEGRRVLEASQRVLGELERAEQDLHLFADGVRGVVRLSTQCYTAYHWVPEVLRLLHAEFPEVELRIQPDATYRVLDALEGGELDVALMYDPPDDDAYTVEEILEDELVAIVPPDHPWANRSYVEASEFAEVTVIVHSDLEESTLYRAVLGPEGVSPAGSMALQLTEALVGATRAGLGVGVLASWAVAREVAEGTVVAVPITRSRLCRRWRAVIPSGCQNRPYLTRLMQLLKGHALRPASSRGAVEPGRRTDVSAD